MKIMDLYENQSELDQPAEVKKNGLEIEHIKNPTEKVQLTAVKQNGRAIQYIKSPSEEIQLAAVREDGFSIKFIENPSEEVRILQRSTGPNTPTIEWLGRELNSIWITFD